MKTKAVKQYKAPRYPDQYQPDLARLLTENRPLHWKAGSAAGVALTAVVMLGLSSCAVREGTPTPPPSAAPLFAQGDGIGVYGCVAIAAPVFLSEDDAFAILSDEFAKQGLTVEKSSTRLENFPLPETQHLSTDDKRGEKPFSTQKGTLEIDFQVAGKPIEMEFVSTEDYDAWAKGNAYSSVESNDFKRAAQTLVNGFGKQEDHQTRAVFYEPAETAPPDANYRSDEAESRRLTEDALRRQVQDFLRWLAANEII